MPSITQISRTPTDARDEWRTPRWFFDWLNRRFRFDVDLAATKDNALCAQFPDDAFAQAWLSLGRVGWCNPNYSDIDPWLVKAVDSALEGFTSVFLIPAPNGEQRYASHVLGIATEIIFIGGRLAFIDRDGRPVSGNTRGSIVAIYEGHNLGNTRYRSVLRDEITKHCERGSMI